jgi:lipid-A-disaccharide synthase
MHVPPPAPRPTALDHLRVAWQFCKTLLAGLPFVFHALLSPLISPWLRRRTGRALARATPPVLGPPPSFDPADLDGVRTIFLVAGEPSGDRMAARIVTELRRLAPRVEVRGYAGPACEAAGVTLDRNLLTHSVVGIFAVAGTLGFWWRLCAESIARFRETPPDLLLTVDFPGLNRRLVGWAHKAGIRTVHVVAPSFWGHAPWRALYWRGNIDLVLTTMPFEAALIERAGLRVESVGHPLFEAPLAPPRTAAIRPTGGAQIELWPGSRKREIEKHAAVLLEAGAALETRLGQRLRFVVRLADPAHEAWFHESARDAAVVPGDVVFSVEARPEPILGAFVTSGTATAELACDLVPSVCFYRIHWLAHVGAFMWVTSPWICLANLVAGRIVVPEFLFRRRRPDLLSEALHGRLDNQAQWDATREELRIVRTRMESEAVSLRLAGHILGELSGAPRGG